MEWPSMIFVAFLEKIIERRKQLAEEGKAGRMNQESGLASINRSQAS